jgi:hypothetical protein
MHPHTPSDRRALESLESEEAAPTERSAVDEGTRYTARAMLFAFLILVAIVALILLF